MQVVNANEAVFSGSNSINVAENNQAADFVAFVDPEGDDISYAIIGGNDATFLSVNASTGLISFVEAPNFEQPEDNDQNNTYELLLQAMDPEGQSIAVPVSLVVTNVNEAPEFVSQRIMTSAKISP